MALTACLLLEGGVLDPDPGVFFPAVSGLDLDAEGPNEKPSPSAMTLPPRPLFTARCKGDMLLDLELEPACSKLLFCGGSRGVAPPFGPNIGETCKVMGRRTM